MINFIIDTQKMIQGFGEDDIFPIVQNLAEMLPADIIDGDVDFKLYFHPTQKATTGQRIAWESASLVSVSDDGLNDALNVRVWLGHPEYLKNPQLVIAGCATIVGKVVTMLQGKNDKHAKGGNFTEAFTTVMNHLNMKIVKRNRVGTNPHTKQLAEKFEAEINRILNFPLTKGFENKKLVPKKRVRMTCAPDCDMNKIRGVFNPLESDLAMVEANTESKCRQCGSEIKVHQDVKATKKDSKKEAVPTN